MLAGTVLAASFIPVFIERATVDTRIMLCLIHVAVAVALLPMLRHHNPDPRPLTPARHLSPIHLTTHSDHRTGRLHHGTPV